MTFVVWGCLIASVIIAWSYWAAMFRLRTRRQYKPHTASQVTDSVPCNHVITDDTPRDGEEATDDHGIEVQGRQSQETTRLPARYPLEQIVLALSRAEWIIRDGGTIRQACIEIGVSETTLLRWRRQYGGLSVDQLQRLKTTEDANASLQQQLGILEAEVERLELANASLRQEFRRIKRVA